MKGTLVHAEETGIGRKGEDKLQDICMALSVVDLRALLGEHRVGEKWGARMELKFKMSQSDKIGGVFTSKKKGVNFQLAAKIELTEEEAALCENYMIINDRLARWQYGIGEGDFEIIRLNELVNGRSFSVDSLGSIIELK